MIDVTAVDVELASTTSAVAAARRANLASFVDAVASFAGLDNDASLPGLIAYLQAEEEYGQGLSLALPSETNSVKLLTVHRAKGLEWDVVFVPGMSAKVFPSGQGRSRWTTMMQELPWPLRGDGDDLPKVLDRSAKGLNTYLLACKEHEEREERRLAYVAMTRPRAQLVVSCHWWGPEQKMRRGPSPFMYSVIDSLHSWGAEPEVWTEPPAPDAVNPANRSLVSYRWPVEAGADEVTRRVAAADLVAQAREVGVSAAMESADAELLLDERALVEQWDIEIARLTEEARSSSADEIVVSMPATLSATAVLRLTGDPAGLAEELARPMPRKPSTAARFGTRFHAWVEGHVGQQQLLEPDDLPGRADVGIRGDSELRELIDAFAAGEFGQRVPLQVEAPFALILGGQVVRGRIDAVYQTAQGYLVVDWKTNRDTTADPLQLAIYRLAWAELAGVDPSAVEAGFYYVRSAELVTPADLPCRDELTALLFGTQASTGAQA